MNYKVITCISHSGKGQSAHNRTLYPDEAIRHRLYNELGLRPGQEISTSELLRRDRQYRRRRKKKLFSLGPQLRAKAFELGGNSSMAKVQEYFGLKLPQARIDAWTDEKARTALIKAGYSTEEVILTKEFRKRIRGLARTDSYFSGLEAYVRRRAKEEFNVATDSRGIEAIGFTGNRYSTPTEEEIQAAIEQFWPREQVEAYKQGEAELGNKKDFSRAFPAIYAAIRVGNRSYKKDRTSFDQWLNNYIPGLANLVSVVNGEDEFIGEDIRNEFFQRRDIGHETLRYNSVPFLKKLCRRINSVAREKGVAFNEAVALKSNLHPSEFVKDLSGIKEVGRTAELLVDLVALGTLVIDPDRDGNIYRNGFAKIFNVPLISVEPNIRLKEAIEQEELDGKEGIENPMSLYFFDGESLLPDKRLLPDMRTVSQKGRNTKNFAIEVKSGSHESNARRLLGRFKEGDYMWWDSEAEQGYPMHGRIAALMMRDKIVNNVRNELTDDGYRVLSSERILCYLGILLDYLGRSPFHKAVAEAVPRLDSLEPVLQHAKDVVQIPHILMRGTRTAERRFMQHNIRNLVLKLEELAELSSEPEFSPESLESELEEVPF
ncbi:hypothetical protein GF371_02415 [Candidatus Woesearchaeota archaeon]|nr:hypothetical protein [Candidatus Woesearchaeota archaeon]